MCIRDRYFGGQTVAANDINARSNFRASSLFWGQCYSMKQSSTAHLDLLSLQLSQSLARPTSNPHPTRTDKREYLENEIMGMVVQGQLVIQEPTNHDMPHFLVSTSETFNSNMY
eukprot:6456662-Amphidinium_carterae.1